MILHEEMNKIHHITRNENEQTSCLRYQINTDLFVRIQNLLLKLFLNPLLVMIHNCPSFNGFSFSSILKKQTKKIKKNNKKNKLHDI